VEKSLENYPYKDIACELKKGLVVSVALWAFVNEPAIIPIS
jgi:hypothetical protein